MDLETLQAARAAAITAAGERFDLRVQEARKRAHREEVKARAQYERELAAAEAEFQASKANLAE